MTAEKKTAEKNDRDEREARRILERVARETEPSGPAQDIGAVRDDPIEYWGTRIGRALGLVLAVAMMVWLGLFLLGHG